MAISESLDPACASFLRTAAAALAPGIFLIFDAPLPAPSARADDNIASGTTHHVGQGRCHEGNQYGATRRDLHNAPFLFSRLSGEANRSCLETARGARSFTAGRSEFLTGVRLRTTLASG
jgi:hypothetical protein